MQGTEIYEDPSGGKKEVKPEADAYIPTLAEAEVAKVLGHGAKKYGAHNWAKGFPWSLSYSAARRHMREFWQGKEADEESGFHPLAHAICQLMFLMEFDLRQKGTDDRPQ